MYINNIKRKNSVLKSKSGFAMLFAVLLASFLITLGVSIFSVSLKEIQMATAVRDSQVAYYAADSARECALYWDVKAGAFPACLNSECSNEPTTIQPTCNGIVTDGLQFFKDNYTYSTYYKDFFKFIANSSTSPIADISITKTFDPDNKIIKTTISAFGHNTSILGRRVERGIQTTNNY